MKKLFTVAVIVITVVSLICGCGKEKKTQNSDGPVEVSMAISSNSETALSNEMPVVREWEKATNTRINFITPGNYDVLLASDDVPDIFRHGNRDNFVRYKNILAPLNELLDTVGTNAKAYYEENPVVKEVATIDGEIRFLTAETLQPDYNGTFAIRKDWLDKLGLEIPETLDDWYNVLKAFKGMGEDIIPFSVRNGRFGLMGFAETFGVSEGASDAKYKGYFINKDGKVEFGPIMPEMKEALVFLNKLYKEGLIDNQYLVTDLTKWQNNIANNRTGVTNDYAVRIEFMNNLVKAADPEAEFVLVLPPKGSDGVRWQGRKTNICKGDGFGIYKHSENKEAAMRLIDYMYTDEGSMLLNLGIEGEHYNVVDGKIELTELLTDSSSGRSVQQNAYKYGIHTFSPYKPLDVVRPVFYSADCIAYTEEYNNADIKGEAVPIFDLPEDKLEIVTNKFSDISTYCDECLDKFIMGTMPIEEFDEFVESVRKMGIDEITSILEEAR